MKKHKPSVYYYVCSFDGTYSGKMQFCGKVRGMFRLTYDEIETLKGQPIIGERLQCPKCKRIFGWHQLKQIEEK